MDSPRAERFSCLVRAQFNQMVIAFYQGNHAHEIEELDALSGFAMSWLIAHGANECINPKKGTLTSDY